MYRIRVIGTGVVGSPYYFNHYFNGINAAGANDALDDLYTGFASSITTFLSMSSEPEAVTISPGDGQATASTVLDSWTVNGGGTGDILPTQVQALIRLGTDTFIAGRRIQGRLNIGGLIEVSQSNGAFLTPEARGDLQAACDLFMAAAAASEWEPCVWSRKNGVGVPITSMTVDSRLATLRSRGSRGQ